MPEFWRNPEFIRHARAELRAPRAITAGLLALVVCALVGLGCWSAENTDLTRFFRIYHVWLVGIQFTVLGFWCASNCGQAISRERDLKTYDFLKTTRLTSTELMVGKILGAPIMAYFVVGCSLPVSLVAGLLGDVDVGTLLGVYVLLIVFALFVSLLGLWISMQLEKSSSGVVGLLALFPIAWCFGFAFSPFPGFGSLSLFPAILTLYRANTEIARIKPTVFGITASFLPLTIFLYAAFGAWLALMMIRNLKKDREQISLLSRWQAVGFGAFLNVLFYAFLDPKVVIGSALHSLRPEDVSSLAMGVNGFFLIMVGLATINPHEKLKIWSRKRSSGEEGYFSESGLPWPWIVASALIAYFLLAAEAFGMRSAVAIDRWQLGTAAVQLVVLLIFVSRDILFLQWCNITSMKRPLMGGILYLGLYYFAVSVISLVASLGSSSAFVFQLFSPWGVFLEQSRSLLDAPGVWIGMGLQLFFVMVILKAISGRLRRPATFRPEAAAA
ncbi:MAG: hypothetical protein ACE145_01110 [Terriglobia bacterium]